MNRVEQTVASLLRGGKYHHAEEALPAGVAVFEPIEAEVA